MREVAPTLRIRKLINPKIAFEGFFDPFMGSHGLHHHL